MDDAFAWGSPAHHDCGEFAFLELRRSPGPGGALVETTHGEQTDLLIRMLSRHQDEIYRYIFALLPHREDARDVLQETSVALLRKVAEYDPEKPFLAWAYRFAYLEVLKQRERNQHAARFLNPEILSRLAREREQHEPILRERLQALEQCLQLLSPADQALIRHRYQGNVDAEALARQLGTSRRTLFRELERIRRVLLNCISRRLTSADQL